MTNTTVDETIIAYFVDPKNLKPNFDRELPGLTIDDLASEGISVGTHDFGQYNSAFGPSIYAPKSRMRNRDLVVPVLSNEFHTGQIIAAYKETLEKLKTHLGYQNGEMSFAIAEFGIGFIMPQVDSSTFYNMNFTRLAVDVNDGKKDPIRIHLSQGDHISFKGERQIQLYSENDLLVVARLYGEIESKS